jgi:Tetratrico peptide repeat
VDWPKLSGASRAMVFILCSTTGVVRYMTPSTTKASFRSSRSCPFARSPLLGAIALPSAELSGEVDALTGAIRVFLALVLADAGRECEVVALALTALAEYLPRYNRLVKRYARQLASEAQVAKKPD